MYSNRLSAARCSRPSATAPFTNFSRSAATFSRIFLPMTLRSVSASPIVNPAITTAVCMTCSW